MSEDPNEQRTRAQDEIIAGALIGIAVLAVFQFLSLTSLDRSLIVALYAFTVSIPLLATYILNLKGTMHYDVLLDRWYNVVAVIGGALASLTGMTAVLWHFSRLLAALFVGLCIFGFIAFMKDD